MIRTILLFAALLGGLSMQAQQVISLAGTWELATEKVTLPGSMLTNGKGELVSVKTQWTVPFPHRRPL